MRSDRMVGFIMAAMLIAFSVFMSIETEINGSHGSTSDDNGDCNYAYYCPGR